MGQVQVTMAGERAQQIEHLAAGDQSSYMWETPKKQSAEDTCDTLPSLNADSNSHGADSDTTSDNGTFSSMSSAELDHISAYAQSLDGGCLDDESAQEAENFAMYSRQSKQDFQSMIQSFNGISFNSKSKPATSMGYSMMEDVYQHRKHSTCDENIASNPMLELLASQLH
jgi:hypothetical protein